MEERRSFPRKKTLKGGAVSCERIGTIECVIRNLSDQGALLEISGATTMPDTFWLIVKPEAVRRQCRVIWRDGRKLGVRFV